MRTRIKDEIDPSADQLLAEAIVLIVFDVVICMVWNSSDYQQPPDDKTLKPLMALCKKGIHFLFCSKLITRIPLPYSPANSP
ncbi:hypothetical protein L6452_12698 [Arctium lappa]|uniref:Uncharacterized protein n=1 Tax=Arctium lappa TaxID=4217 RepID=A0ACB9DQW4_ARCLA|nr:hypothetical protein L6452_12698 [Arctium lappa]